MSSHIKITLSILFIAACGLIAYGQDANGDYNPYVNNGKLDPSPLWPAQINGGGVLTFEMGNTGDSPLSFYNDQYVTLTITMSYGEPDAVNPLEAVAGTAAGFFTWSYSEGTYTAKQVSDIPSGFSGVISIGYRVTNNSIAPGINGFNVNITPAPYHTNSNSQSDDAVSSYTFTNEELILPSVPTGLSLLSVSDQHIAITWTASTGVNGIAGYQVYRDDSFVGETADLTYIDSTVTAGEDYIYAVAAIDSLGYESERSDTLKVSVLGVNVYEVSQIQISPNPSDGVFHVLVDNAYGSFVIDIISVKGDILLQRNVEIRHQGEEITLQGEILDSGIYTIRIHNQNSFYFGKLIIIKR